MLEELWKLKRFGHGGQRRKTQKSCSWLAAAPRLFGGLRCCDQVVLVTVVTRMS
jgi:hypothetical protein